jgi:magnesium transporter
MARTRLYRDGVLVAEGFPVRDVPRHLADPAATVWLDLCRPRPDEFAAVGDALGLHELAREDALHSSQRPKLDNAFPIQEVVQRWDRATRVTEPGVALLLHGLLDFLVDGHFTAVQQLDEQVEALDDLLFTERREQIQQVQRQAFLLRRSLVRLRRVVLPMR